MKTNPSAIVILILCIRAAGSISGLSSKEIRDLSNIISIITAVVSQFPSTATGRGKFCTGSPTSSIN
jgi:hypothetical protein